MRPLVALLALAAFRAATFALTAEQQRVPLEVDSPDKKLAKIVLIAGSVSATKPGGHEYFAGCALLMNCLRATPGVWPVMAAEGWPKNEAIFDGAKAVVIYADGGAKLSFLAPERWAKIEQLIKGGTGFVMLHQGVEVPADHAPEFQSWLGGVFQPDIGCRGHWDMDFANFPAHPITRGVQPFSAPLDGWLYNLHFAPQGVTPLFVGAVPDKARTSADAKAHPGRDEVIGWVFERAGGGRSFGFTGADWHANWSVESQRRLIVNGILWTAGIEVPAAGAPVPLAPGDITKNHDDKPAPAPKPAAVTPAN